MKKHTEPMMDFCEIFDTEEKAIAAFREVNRGLDSRDPACCVVVDGPENNYAVRGVRGVRHDNLDNLSRASTGDDSKIQRIFAGVLGKLTVPVGNVRSVEKVIVADIFDRMGYRNR